MAGGGRPVSASELWGPILSAALNHVTTAELFDKYINPAVERLGGSLSFETVQNISRLRSNANQVAVASENLMAAPENYARTAEMIGTPFYGRAFQGVQTVPSYEVTFEANVLTPLGLETRNWRISYGADLPDTVGGILEDVNAFAQDYANKYNSELVSTGRVFLNLV